MPSTQEPYQIVNSGIDPEQDMFAKSCKSKQREVYGDAGWPEYLEGAYVGYKSALTSKYGSEWDSILHVFFFFFFFFYVFKFLPSPMSKLNWFALTLLDTLE